MVAPSAVAVAASVEAAVAVAKGWQPTGAAAVADIMAVVVAQLLPEPTAWAQAVAAVGIYPMVPALHLVGVAEAASQEVEQAANFPAGLEAVDTLAQPLSAVLEPVMVVTAAPLR